MRRERESLQGAAVAGNLGCLVLAAGVVAAGVAGAVSGWSILWKILVGTICTFLLLRALRGLLHRRGQRRNAAATADLDDAERERRELETRAYQAQRDAYEQRLLAEQRERDRAASAKAEEKRGQWESRFANVGPAYRDGGAELVSAFTSVASLCQLQGSWIWGHQGALEAAGRQLFDGEEIVHVGVGERNFRRQAVVVTTARLGVITAEGAVWRWLKDVERVKTLYSTLQGTYLEIYVGREKWYWANFEPRHAAAEIRWDLLPTSPPLAGKAWAKEGPAIAEAKAVYAGGTIPGMFAKQVVKVDVTQDGILRISRKGRVLARYRASRPGGSDVDGAERAPRLAL